MKFIVGQKVAMTQIWQGDNVIPVTEVKIGPCTVLQIKTMEKDGYRAVQLGYGKRRSSLITKALKGHFKGFGDFRTVKEFRLDDKENIGDLKPGDQISVATFAVGDILTVIGTSKGKGFQGVVKRHGFHGQDATHGNKDQLRASGSVGAGGVQHVFKGVRMAGRMGGDRVTLHDVKIVEIDETNNTLFIKGALPGARHGLIMLFGEGELKTGLPVAKEIKEETTSAPEEATEGKETTVEDVKEENKVETKEPASASEEAMAVKETPVEPVAEPVKEPEAPVAEAEKASEAEVNKDKTASASDEASAS